MTSSSDRAANSEATAVEARFKRWRDFRSGRIEVDPVSVQFFGGRMLGKPELKLRVEGMSLLNYGFSERGRDSIMSISFEGADGVAVSEAATLAEPGQVEKLRPALQRFLDMRDAERKAREEEEKKRAEEREQLALKNRREYVDGVWSLAGVLWGVSTLLYGLVEAARIEDWGRARQHYVELWQQGERLKSDAGVDPMRVLETLGADLRKEEGENVVKQAVAFLDIVSPSFVDPKPLLPGWQEIDAAREGISPNWSHLGCFLLFALSFGEARHCFEIGDWRGLERSVVNLSNGGAVVSDHFGISLDEQASAVAAAARGRDGSGFHSATDQLQQVVAAALAEHGKKESGPGQTDGAVS